MMALTTALSFALGCLCSAAAGYIGNIPATPL
jgi:Na+/H+-translocating membrane pyrophosphatase